MTREAHPARFGSLLSRLSPRCIYAWSRSRSISNLRISVVRLSTETMTGKQLTRLTFGRERTSTEAYAVRSDVAGWLRPIERRDEPHGMIEF